MNKIIVEKIYEDFINILNVSQNETAIINKQKFELKLIDEKFNIFVVIKDGVETQFHVRKEYIKFNEKYSYLYVIPEYKCEDKSKFWTSSKICDYSIALYSYWK